MQPEADPPFFSIIIPVLNAANTISACLDSILSQHFAGFEIIVEDGRSTDSTAEIVETYTRQDARVRLISGKDNGIYDAMNKGLHLSTGKWVYFLGADDKLYGPNVLADIHAIASGDAYDVIYGNVYHDDFKRIYDGEFTDEKICRDGICHQSIFYRRELLLTRGGYRVDMKAYAHIFLDKILFTDGAVRWKFVDLVIANYAGRGFSRTYFDAVYWNEAEKLLNEHFKNRVSKKIIYESLQPVVDNEFSLKSFFLSWRIAYYSKSFYPIGKWFGHPFGIARLLVKKLIPK